MGVRIRDTLQREIVELVPRDPGRVTMYVCGPTVYDAPHIGNARTAVVFDTMRRYLEWTGLEVTYVTNVTDVDDKIIERAAEQGRTEPDLAAEVEAVYFEQMAQLNVREPDVRPHATEYIGLMIDLVTRLVEAGHAYAVAGQGVYFDVESFPGYGALPHRSIAELRESAGARVEVDEAKRAPMDFALWKAAKPGEPAWDSPWGKGRPGWHIECSAMSLDLLGDGFDLHGGGSDLLFPHHENERAQANAAGHEFARHWVHSGMVTIGGEKMAKSLGNFLTLRDAIAGYDARAVRLAMLQTNYARAVDLGPTELDGAAAALASLDALVRRAHQAGIDVDEAPADVAPGDVAPGDVAVAEFRAAMDDDFNTPRAIAAIFDARSRANRAIDVRDPVAAAPLVAAVVQLAAVLGIDVGVQVSADADVDALVRERDEAREARDFARADAIRDQLAAMGVKIEDGPRGTTWHR